MPFIQEFVKLMAVMEGFSKQGTISWKNNNPCNLITGRRAKGRDEHQYAIYDKVADGFADAEDLIAEVIGQHPGLTLRTIVAGQRDANGLVLPNGYYGLAPSADTRGVNHPLEYAQYFATALKIGIDDALLPHLGPVAYPAPQK